jgi:hypothetical protein
MPGMPDVLTETPARACFIAQSSVPSTLHHAMFDECCTAFHDRLFASTNSRVGSTNDGALPAE